MNCVPLASARSLISYSTKRNGTLFYNLGPITRLITTLPPPRGKQAAVDRISQDLYQVFLDPDHVTPPPPPVPEGDGPILPNGETGTSVNEGATSIEGAQSVVTEGDPSLDDSTPLSKRVQFIDELDYKQEPTKLERSRRTTRNPKPKYAAVCSTYKSRLQNSGRPRYQRQQYLAGGNHYSKSKDSDIENARIHGLDWNPEALLSSAPTGTAKSILHETLMNSANGD